jgi:hypothetical protein
MKFVREQAGCLLFNLFLLDAIILLLCAAKHAKTHANIHRAHRLFFDGILAFVSLQKLMYTLFLKTNIAKISTIPP